MDTSLERIVLCTLLDSFITPTPNGIDKANLRLPILNQSSLSRDVSPNLILQSQQTYALMLLGNISANSLVVTPMTNPYCLATGPA